MNAAIAVILGVATLFAGMGRANDARNWPTQIGWVLISFAALAFFWLAAYAEVKK